MRVDACKHLAPRVPRVGLHPRVALSFEGSCALHDLLRLVEATKLAERTAELPEVALEKRVLVHCLEPLAKNA